MGRRSAWALRYRWRPPRPRRLPDRLRAAVRHDRPGPPAHSDGTTVIQIRLVADDVDQVTRAARVLGQVLTITKESRPRPRRSGEGFSLYLGAELDADPESAR